MDKAQTWSIFISDLESWTQTFISGFEKYSVSTVSGKRKSFSDLLLYLLFPSKALLLVDSTWPPCDDLEVPPGVWKFVVGFVLHTKLHCMQSLIN